MIMSKVLTVEELERMRNLPVVYTQDAPKLTKEQLARMKPKRRVQSEEMTGAVGKSVFSTVSPAGAEAVAERWLAETAAEG
jgi:hypothetical protein